MFSIFKKLRAVRGAISTENVATQIKKDSFSLYTEIVEANKIREKDIVVVQFSLTKDLFLYNPCTALREEGLLLNTALFTSLEPHIEGTMPCIMRILVLYYGRRDPIYVYKKEAKNLRKI